MLVIFIGYFSEFVGVTILLLPLLFRELSRPRDSFFGGLIIIFGLILVTGHDRFAGPPSFAVILQALVFIILAIEISQYRWQFLSIEEKKSLKSIDRFNTNIKESFFAIAKLGSILLELFKFLQPKEEKTTKKWIRTQTSKEENPLQDENLDSIDSKKSHPSTGPDQISSPTNENITPEDS